MNPATHIITDQKAGDSALAKLTAAGWRRLARNDRCPQGGLDRVMTDGDSLQTVELCFRRERGFGDAAASGARKQQKLLHATQHFLRQAAGQRLGGCVATWSQRPKPRVERPKQIGSKDAFRAD